MSIRTDRPMASSAVYPNICFAPAFQLRMTLSRVFPTIASSDDSTIAASHSDGLFNRCMAHNYVVRATHALRQRAVKWLQNASQALKYSSTHHLIISSTRREAVT